MAAAVCLSLERNMKKHSSRRHLFSCSVAAAGRLACTLLLLMAAGVSAPMVQRVSTGPVVRRKFSFIRLAMNQRRCRARLRSFCTFLSLVQWKIRIVAGRISGGRFVPNVTTCRWQLNGTPPSADGPTGRWRVDNCRVNWLFSRWQSFCALLSCLAAQQTRNLSAIHQRRNQTFKSAAVTSDIYPLSYSPSPEEKRRNLSSFPLLLRTAPFIVVHPHRMLDVLRNRIPFLGSQRLSTSHILLSSC